MRSVQIIDYGIGNLFSVARAIEAAGGRAELIQTPDAILQSDRLILPGVGAFEKCANRLFERGLAETICAFVRRGRPMLGICVGMQLLMEVSHEFGMHQGLALLEGEVVRIPERGLDGNSHKVPHVGWNALEFAERVAPSAKTFFTGIPHRASAYFVHSYHAVPNHAADVAAVTSYDDVLITAAVSRDNVIGVQFHPEKSGPVGLTMLANFLSL